MPSHHPRKRPLLGHVLLASYRHPWIFWVLVWMSVATVAGIALTGMINPGFDGDSVLKANTSQTGVQVAEQPVFVYQPNYPDTGMAWVVAAIALSCSFSSFLILKRLTNPWKATPQPTVASKRGKKRLTSHYPFLNKQSPVKQQSPKQQSPKQQSPKQPAATRVPVPATKSTVKSTVQPATRTVAPRKPVAKTMPRPRPYPVVGQQPLAGQYVSVREQMQAQPTKNNGLIKPMLRNPKGKPKPKVSVVPPEKSHVLDWGDAGLAYRMDIRKRRSYQ